MNRYWSNVKLDSDRRIATATQGDKQALASRVSRASSLMSFLAEKVPHGVGSDGKALARDDSIRTSGLIPPSSPGTMKSTASNGAYIWMHDPDEASSAT